MGLKMRNFNIERVDWKIRFLGEGEEAHEKPIYWGKLAKKGRLGQFADLMEGLAKIRGWGGGCFWGESCYLNAHYVYLCS